MGQGLVNVAVTVCPGDNCCSLVFFCSSVLLGGTQTLIKTVWICLCMGTHMHVSAHIGLDFSVVTST